MFEVEFYSLADGTKPVGQFIKSIEDDKLRAKVIRSINWKPLEASCECRKANTLRMGFTNSAPFKVIILFAVCISFIQEKNYCYKRVDQKNKKNTPGGNRACKNKES